MAEETAAVEEKQPRTLRDKAIDIKGKKYVLVSDRVLFFNEHFPEGSIVTEIISPVDADKVVLKATVSPDQKRFFIGHSQAKWGDGYINKTSALENAETSAVGRALAFMGIGVLDSIASVDEINKANNTAAANGEAKIIEAENAFDQRNEGDPCLAIFQMRHIQELATKNGITDSQLMAFMKAKFGVERVEKVKKSDFETLRVYVAGQMPIQEALQTSVAGLGRTIVDKIVGEDDVVSIEGLLGSVAQRVGKTKKPFLAIKMQDGVELSDWHLDHESTLKECVGKKVEFLAVVKSVGDKTFYNVDSLEIHA